MCGIAGVMLREGEIQAEWLHTVAARLRHRGPDGTGHFAEGRCGLVHTRLAIIDLEGGKQPILDETGRLALIANGEIYNYVELRAELEAEGRVFATHSDSETILQAYAATPERFVERLRGMFAFALFDGRRQCLILARDRLGIKPLYYARLPDRVVFASELKALLPLLPRSPEVDADALSLYLHNHCSGGEGTLLGGVKRLRPGEVIEIDADLTLRQSIYWNPLHVATRERSFAEANEEFDALFTEVMQEHMRSDVPYGLFLSGGNDSAVVLAMLSRLGSEPVRSFNVGYQDASVQDEQWAAERIAQVFGSRHQTVRLQRSSFFRRLPHTVWAADDLIRDGANLPTSALSEAAAKELKVVFCGEGGDEVFGGYRRYRDPPLLRWAKDRLAPGSGGFRVRSEWWRRSSQKLLGPELAARRHAFRQPVIEAWQTAPTEWSHLQHCQYADIRVDLAGSLLVKVDRMMMGFGLEGRVPFLDHRVVEFGLSLPDHLKIGGGQPKTFLRRWAERYIPRDHLYTKKRSFVVPVREWLSGEVLDRLEQKLLRNEAVREWFDTARLPTVFQLHRKRGIAAREIVGLTQFAIWHRLFIEEPGLQPTPDEDPLEWIS